MVLGRLYIEVGVSPVRPAEFIVFRIAQWNGSEDEDIVQRPPTAVGHP